MVTLAMWYNSPGLEREESAMRSRTIGLACVLLCLAFSRAFAAPISLNCYVSGLDFANTFQLIFDEQVGTASIVLPPAYPGQPLSEWARGKDLIFGPLEISGEFSRTDQSTLRVTVNRTSGGIQFLHYRGPSASTQRLVSSGTGTCKLGAAPPTRF